MKRSIPGEDSSKDPEVRMSQACSTNSKKLVWLEQSELRTERRAKLCRAF